ncbi:response regulator transcription factor [Paroceanicella profunda]|uniref:Response regulator transcription factor n=1 Tax=Paroceanicella profunda TaxID=2579971 RepID=A0A5B8FTM0_9RHOB|nr:response regulator [Paroceanicella profunda]QDL90410.1 response regulator transcription factor [Paroceanicella profunda]
MHARTEQPTVVVIDDDDGVCEALCGLFQSVGLRTTCHGSVQEFVSAEPPARPSCIVLDIRLPGRSGLEFQESLARNGARRPVVLISAHVDVPMTVRAMKAGAVDVLTKPVREQDLLEAVHRAVTLDADLMTQAERSASLCTRYATLTERERQVMALVATGLLNKQIAARIDVTEATVKLHRGHVMRKMAAGSLPELVRMSDILGEAGSHKT